MACTMKRCDAMRHTLLTALVAIAGCMSGPELEGPEGPGGADVAEEPAGPSLGDRPPGVIYVAGEQEQGRRLLGSYADTFMSTANGHFRVAGSSSSLPGRVITVEGASLVVKNGGVVEFSDTSSLFNGLRLPAV